MIPQPFTLIFPLLASYLAAWLKDAKLPAWANYAIACTAFALAVAASIAFGSGLTGHAGEDIGIIVTECGMVFALLKPVLDTMKATSRRPFSAMLRSPLGAMAARAAKRAERQRETDEMWAIARANVPSRASAAQPGIDTMPPDAAN